MSLLLTKVMAMLVMLAVASTPGATVVANSTFYEQIFSAPTQTEFENALGFFFSESLSSLNYTYTYLLMPVSQPTTNITLQAGDYLESKYISTELVTRLDIYLRVIGTAGTSFHILFTQGSTILLDEDRSAVATMWYHFDLPTPYRSGSFTLRITLAGDTIRGGVFLTDSGAFTSTGATVANTSTYSHTHYDPEWQAYRGVTETISDVISVNLEKTTKNGWIYTYSKETSTLYTLYRNIYTDNMITSTLLGYLDYPSMLTYSPLLEGGINYEFPTDLRIFLQDAINKEQNIDLPYDRESFFQSLITVATNPSNASNTDWETVTTDSEFVLAPLLPAPDNYQIDKRMINGEPVPVLTRKQTNIVETCVASHVKRVRMENEYGGLIWVYITVCDEYGTIDVSSYTDIARITSSTQYSTVPDDLLLLAVQPEGERPSTPYFWDWVLEGYENNGHTVDQELKNQLAEAHPLSPITKTNVSLIINPKAPKGVSPYVAEITVQDEHGNQIIGILPVTISNTTHTLNTGFVTNGYANFTLDYYQESITAIVAPNEFFYGSQGIGVVQYDLEEILQRQGHTGTDPIHNTKLSMFRDYIRNSGAFDYDPTTEIHTMVDDLSHKWVDNPWPYPAVTRGYELISNVEFTEEEVSSGYFESNTIKVKRYYGINFPVEQRTTEYTLTKEEFLTMWLSMKIRPWSIGGNPPEPHELTNINDLGADIHEMLILDQNWMQENPTLTQEKFAKNEALTTLATKTEFPNKDGFEYTLLQFYLAVMKPLVAFIAIKEVLRQTNAVDTIIAIWDTVLGIALDLAEEIIKEIVIKILAEVAKLVIIAVSPFYNPDPNIEPLILGNLLVDALVVTLNVVYDSTTGLSSLFGILSIILLLSSLLLILANTVNHVLRERVAELSVEVEGKYELPSIYDTVGYTGREGFFKPGEIRITGMSFANLVAYILSFPIREIARSINLVENFLFGGRVGDLEKWDTGDIGEIISLLYLTTNAGLGVWDIGLYDVYMFGQIFGKKFKGVNTPDFIIKLGTFFEVKATASDASPNEMLGAAYKDLKEARWMKTARDNLIYGDINVDLIYNVLDYVAGFNTWGGISAFDVTNKLLIVQWLEIEQPKDP